MKENLIKQELNTMLNLAKAEYEVLKSENQLEKAIEKLHEIQILLNVIINVNRL
jgi:hypothetical protein